MKVLLLVNHQRSEVDNWVICEVHELLIHHGEINLLVGGVSANYPLIRAKLGTPVLHIPVSHIKLSRTTK